jgi:hypothetical protein
MGRGQRLGAALTSLIALVVGVLTLLSLLLGNNPELYQGLGPSEGVSNFATLIGLPASVFIRLVAITVAVTIIIGIVNLLRVHLGRVTRGAIYSLVLLVSFGGTILWYIINKGDTSLLEAVQVPIESSLAGLLFLSLVYGGARIMQVRPNRWSILFVAVMLIVLLGTIPLSSIDPIRQLSEWLMTVPVSGGARGILLGIALATVVTGIRVLVGQDRSYRG